MKQSYNKYIKILVISLINLSLESNIAFAQLNSINNETLSPSLNISNQSFKIIIENTLEPTSIVPFFTRRPKNWETRTIPLPQQWPKRNYLKAQFELEALTEKLMVYPKELLNSPDLFAHLDVTDPGIAYDIAHFEFNYQTGYWHSKDFPELVLGTWEDIEKKFPKTSSIMHNRSKMKRHVVTRFKNPHNNKTISFYFFDNHAYSVPYALEAKQRKEIPKSQIDHIVVDQHSDSLNALNFTFPKTLSKWRELVESDHIAMNSFHSIFGRLNMFSRLIWTFDGEARNYTSRAKAVADLKLNSGCETVKGICMSEYANLSSRPQDTQVFLNIDVDTTDQMLEIDNDVSGYKRIVYPKETLYFYTNFLKQLIRKDKTDIVSFQASTTSWFRREDGDVETARYLGRLAPAIILLGADINEDTLQTFINNIINQHKTKLTIGQRLTDKLEILSRSKSKNNSAISNLTLLINRSI